MQKLILILVLLCWPFTAGASETVAKQAVILDAETGTVIFSKNADQQMPTSSMSKVMSMVVVFDALKNGVFTLDDELLVSEKAWRKGGSKMFVEVNKKVKVEDLIRGVIIQSGNDATIVLAEGLEGSEEAFANRLNEKAQEIGMNASQFKNASGWPDPEHYSTASDLAMLGKYLIETYPEYYKYYAEKEFEYNEIKQANRNPLLYRDIGADGIKTGHTDAGGYGLMASGVRDERRVIMVLNGMDSERTRAQEAAKLLDWALGRFENKTIFKAGEILGSANVHLGKTKTVDVALKEDLRITLPKAAKKNIKASINYQTPLQAPIEAGQVVAELEIEIPDMAPLKRPLVTVSAVEEVGFVGKALQNLKTLLNGL